MKGGCQCERCQETRGHFQELRAYLYECLGTRRSVPPVPNDHREDYLDALGAVEAILEKDPPHQLQRMEWREIERGGEVLVPCEGKARLKPWEITQARKENE